MNEFLLTLEETEKELDTEKKTLNMSSNCRSLKKDRFDLEPSAQCQWDRFLLEFNEWFFVWIIWSADMTFKFFNHRIRFSSE